MIKTLGFVTVFGLFSFGQVAPDIPLSAWANLPAMGLLMFLLYWIVVKQQPKERKEAREHTEKIATQLGADFKEVQKLQYASQQEMVGKIGELAENCRSHLGQPGK